MACYIYFVTLLVISGRSNAAPSKSMEQKTKTLVTRQENKENDLKTASSSYSHQYSNWGGTSPGGYGFSVTGFGTIDDNKSSFVPGYNSFSGYENSLKNTAFDNSGYKGVTGYGSNVGLGGYAGDSGFGQTGGYGPSGYSPKGYGSIGLGASSNGPTNFGTSGYGPTNFGASGYEPTGLGDGGGYSSIGGFGSGNGGYGGYGGNGGLNSYYGYNNPSYQGGGHLGYGYYNKKFGSGNIYSSGITPSLVTGYRGYTRR